MRLAPWLLAAVIAPSVSAAQSVPPWPAAHTPHPQPDSGPSEADYSLAMPGRVPLELLSSRAQNVVIVRRSRALVDTPLGSTHVVLGSATCTTPCTVYLPPGPVTVRAAARGIRDTEEDVEVPATGGRVRIRTASRALYNLGTGLVAGGSTVFVAEAVAAVAAQARGDAISSGAAVLGAAVAAALLAGGVPLMVSARSGVESVVSMDPPQARTLTLSAAPVADGALALACVTW